MSGIIERLIQLYYYPRVEEEDIKETLKQNELAVRNSGGNKVETDVQILNCRKSVVPEVKMPKVATYPDVQFRCLSSR